MAPSRKWTNEKIISDIRKVGVPIHARVPHQLYVKAKHYFGSWKVAVEASGYNYDEIRQTEILELRERNRDWNKRTIVHAIGTMQLHNIPITSDWVCSNESGLFGRALYLFGTWDNALTASGLNPDNIKLKNRDIKIKVPEQTSDLAYFYGVLIGDGTINPVGKVICNATDFDMVERFASIGEKCFGIKANSYYVEPDERYGTVLPQLRVIFYSREMSDYVLRESHGKRCVPEWIINGPDEVMAAFIRGFADAEGNVRADHAEVGITQKDREILEIIKQMLSKMGIDSVIYLKDKKANCHVLIIRRLQNVQHFADKVGFAIPRKVERLKKWQMTSVTRKHRGWVHT